MQYTYCWNWNCGWNQMIRRIINAEIIREPGHTEKEQCWWPGNLEILKNETCWWPGNLKILKKTNHVDDLVPGKAPCCLGCLRKNPFWEHVPENMSSITLEIMSTLTIFSKWLPRPNHYAHEICIKILSRTPVSILKYVSLRPQNLRNSSKYSFLAWMSTWISRWSRRRRRRRRADNSPIWQEP